ncbi:3D domain-containing protein [Cohnella sp. REN36]|uniref:3D domain-containing protein n=1 Tax=Cohnella sp. REN36 TaxID=2887347 RepID=UPI0027154CC7|nr:3D domain-containing protein [Cohnella sp. REN36]
MPASFFVCIRLAVFGVLLLSALPLGRADAKPPEADGKRSSEVVSVVATGYTAGVESTGKRPGHPQYGITKSGVKVRRSKVSTIAADPRVFPLGTVLFIPGYGYGCVADTGSRIKGNKIDLYFPSTRQVFREWGKKTVSVQVVRWGAGKVTEAMLDAMNEVVAAQQDFSTKIFDS